ncbi:MAG TPA: hydrogenase 4 subunit B [Gammaproteobacteria bacterium]|nr:hydrogenase 4 subunit B [Gammaproteobacteria bacterium]
MSSTLIPLQLAIGISVLWMGLGFAGLGLQRYPRVITTFLFPLSAVGALILALTALLALKSPPSAVILGFGLPDLPFHLRLDSLACFFLLLLGAVVFGIGLFSSGYFRTMKGLALGLLFLQYHIFIASMVLVLLADDAYLFMVTWESMAISSYFLVTTDHHLTQVRKAGFLYLLMAHVGAISILLCFGVMQGGQGDYSFDALREVHLSNFWMSVSFLLALLGFGAKAGMAPLHVWLPEAHPAAPSPVSALMSAVMLKTAIYGILRVCFDLLSTQLWWWGALILALGLVSALLGVMFAAVQTDMKRLLAYSSIENIGIILAGIGLTIIFQSDGKGLLAALTLTATLYHCINHAFFKGLLFLGTGAVLHATGERNLGRLGGLIQRMPWVAALTLVGALAIAGLPPLNGFVSEWLLLQAFLLSPGLAQPYLNMLVPVAAAALVLATALSAYVMVKFYGVIFLGQARAENIQQTHDAGGWERAGLGWLALGCIALGLMPVAVILQLDAVTHALIGQSLGGTAARSSWLFLTPVAASRASYSPVFFLLVILVVVLISFLAVRLYYGGKLKRGPAWDCGYPAQTPRIQNTAEGFGQPIRHIFGPVFHTQAELPRVDDPKPKYRIAIQDHFWHLIYLPIARCVEFSSRQIGKLQQGRIHIYLLYSFLTLLLLLLLMR